MQTSQSGSTADGPHPFDAFGPLAKGPKTSKGCELESWGN